MKRQQFKNACRDKVPPRQPLLKALWLDFLGRWDEAHQLVDDLGTEEAAWIHAYLHRKEGDPWNAGYWYRRASKEVETSNLEEEWDKLVNYFCDED